MIEVRCPHCKRKLCELKGSAEIHAKCTRCKKSFTHPQTDVEPQEAH